MASKPLIRKIITALVARELLKFNWARRLNIICLFSWGHTAMLKRFMTVAASTYAETPIPESSFYGVFRGCVKLLDPRNLLDPIEEQLRLEAAPVQHSTQPGLPEYRPQMEV